MLRNVPANVTNPCLQMNVGHALKGLQRFLLNALQFGELDQIRQVVGSSCLTIMFPQTSPRTRPKKSLILGARIQIESVTTKVDNIQRDLHRRTTRADLSLLTVGKPAVPGPRQPSALLF